MWLAEPRWSFGPHFEGHRFASAGGCHDWDSDWDTGLTSTAITARTNADATAMRGIRLMAGFILIPPQKIVRRLGAQASWPACFGQSVIAGNPAGQDACAPKRDNLGLRFSLFQEARRDLNAPRKCGTGYCLSLRMKYAICHISCEI
jgi:hypothetical protein